MPHISCKVITSYRCFQTAPPIRFTQVSNQLLFFINNQQVRITLHPQNVFGLPLSPLKNTPQQVCFRSNELVSLFFFMIPLIEYDCTNSLTLLGWSMTRQGWGSTWMTITTVLMIGSRMVSLTHQYDYRICCLPVWLLHFINRSLVATISSDPCSKLRTRSVLQVDCRGIML